MQETIEKTPPEITALYKGTVEVKFFPDSHIYYINGKRKRSVTGPIGIIDKSKALIGWALDLAAEHLEGHVGKKLTQDLIDEAVTKHEEKKREAANIGTAAHAWIESYVKGQKPEMPEHPSAAQAVAGFLDWVKRNKVEFISSEKVVYSKKYDYAGTVDAIARMNGGRKRYVIDYKVSNGLYPGVAYQTAAYMHAETEESGQKYEGRWALRLSKETEDEYYERQEKKRRRWMKRNPDKEPYEITPYQAFESRYLDEYPDNYELDFEGFITAAKLTEIHRNTESRFKLF